MKFWNLLKNMGKKQKIVLVSSVVVVIAIIAVLVAVIVNRPNAKEVVSSKVVKENAEKLDAFDGLQGEIIEDEKLKVQIEETYRKFLIVDRYTNSSIGPVPGLLSELGLVEGEELNQWIESKGVFDPKEYIETMVKYEDFKAEMLCLMTEEYFQKHFSDYKEMNGYVGVCNSGGGVPVFEVEKCDEIKRVSDTYVCKMIIKDVEIFEHFLSGEDSEFIEYQDCFIGQIVDFQKVNENMVVDKVRLYEGEIEVEEITVDLQDSEEVSEEQLEEAKVSPEETKTGSANYYIKVNYGANTVTIYGKDEAGNYTVPVKAMICSCGISTPKSGVYKTSEGYRWGTLIGGVYGQYSTRIVGNILFHSVPYTAQSPDSLEYWEFDKLGTKASAGCVRLMVTDAKWIYNNCRGGTMVEFYSSEDPGPLGKPSAPKISDNERCRGWDPTDPLERKSLER